jgi:hypothetical protein
MSAYSVMPMHFGFLDRFAALKHITCIHVASVVNLMGRMDVRVHPLVMTILNVGVSHG